MMLCRGLSLARDVEACEELIDGDLDLTLRRYVIFGHGDLLVMACEIGEGESIESREVLEGRLAQTSFHRRLDETLRPRARILLLRPLRVRRPTFGRRRFGRGELRVMGCRPWPLSCWHCGPTLRAWRRSGWCTAP